MPLKLYQFAISHYSEKVRWALDYKGIAYEPEFLLPGMHGKTVCGLTGQGKTSVPVLVDSGMAIQGSNKILDHLDSAFPDKPLLPQDTNGQAAARAWEERLDDEAGPAVRTFAYHHLLQRPKVVAPLLTAKTAFWNQYLLRLGFSRVDEAMREMMNINEKTAARAQATIENLLEEINGIYRDGQYLAGASFSRADITAGALFAPLFMPPEYPVPWPKPGRLPPGLKEWHQQRGALLEPVAECYRTHH
ncbi:glutathione S-transferase family protein [Marinobacter bryozoorum]|uniref:glutathione S-transferase family protein n=1 Tax=Marinobacter bryozoorum TaxID=256324 RepID=UPI00200515ED|nr:glutathione S-transferase family protein [Marinobacter bryozoorum]MCK7542708.1 glutathione S-transferase family protein [Marinobacter bryozoorum]